MSIQTPLKNHTANFTTTTKTKHKYYIFDLHGVIFKLDKKRVLYELWSAPYKRGIVICCLNPYFLWTATRLWLTMPVLEQFILAMMDRFVWLRPNREAALRTANALKPIQPTVDAMRQLNANGAQLYVFSNIGTESMAIIKEQFPDVMSMITGIVHTGPADGYCAKPAQQAFAKFFASHPIDPTLALFIDDKPKNLKMAQHCGLRTHHFRSAAQLAHKLNI